MLGEIDAEQYAIYDGPYESWWLDTPFGCRWVGTCNTRIIAGAPIFQRHSGWDLHRCPKHFIYEKIADETKESLDTDKPHSLNVVADSFHWLRPNGSTCMN